MGIRTHKTFEDKYFQEFWELVYSDEVDKFKMHHFQVTNSKKSIRLVVFPSNMSSLKPVSLNTAIVKSSLITVEDMFLFQLSMNILYNILIQRMNSRSCLIFIVF